MGRLVWPLVIILGVGSTLQSEGSTTPSKAAAQPADAVVQDVVGNASYCMDGTWHPLKKNMKLGHGAVIKTEADSTVDLLLHSSLTALRLTPESSLRLDKLNREVGFDAEITETTLTLLTGSIAGTQRKLAAPSRFQINVADEVVTIIGTEYYVRADGAVTVVSGAVSVYYHPNRHGWWGPHRPPGSGGPVKVIVPAGYSFDPATGQVVPTTPAYLKKIIAHIETTRKCAKVFRVRGAVLVVRPERYISPH